MEMVRSCWRKHKAACVVILLSILVIGGVFVFDHWKWIVENLKSILLSLFTLEKRCESDDQRSAMWPMIVSMTVALLGSIITTYVFSKDTMDGILNERPYYHEIIAGYRRKTMALIWGYIFFTAISIFSILALYFFYYFQRKRFPDSLRAIVFAVSCIAGIFSVRLIWQCIYSEKHLQKDAKKQLKHMKHQMKEYARCSGTSVRLPVQLPGVRGGELLSWLGIEARTGSKKISYRKFVSVFSKWEGLLILLAQQQPESGSSNMTLDQQIEFTIQTGSDAYKKEKDGRVVSFEWEDARENEWSFVACKEVRDCEKDLEDSARVLSLNQRLGSAESSSKGASSHLSALVCFMDEYCFLARYRDLCKVILDGKEGNAQKESSEDIAVDKEDTEYLANIFYFFLASLFTQALRTAPTIKLFFPAGLFAAADFYNIRFNDSLFRSSKFQSSIFARAKIKDSNFSLSLFERCNLYSADCRDCTFTNTSWSNCFLKDAYLENVDFTGAELFQCDLRGTRFHGVVFQNLQVENSVLGRNDFQDSRLEKINLVPLWSPRGRVEIQGCNFSNSILSEIVLQPEERFASSSCRFAPLKAEMDNPKLRKVLFFGTGEQKDVFLDRMDKFSPPKDLFSVSMSAAVQGHRGHPVWGDIEKNTVIFMNESVFKNAVLSTPYFYRVSLTQSVLTGAQMDGALFFGTDMSGCIMPEANLLGARLWAVVLQSAVLKDAILFKSCCKLVNFEDADLRDLHTSEAVLYSCSFSRSDCSRIDLTRAKVWNSAFVDSILTGAELTDAEFHSVCFDNSVASSMLATYTKFEHCQMCGAELTGSSFNSAVFEDCDFRLTDCSGSVVANAVFKRCSFAGCNFKKTRFVNVKIEDCSCLDTAEFEDALFINLELKGTNRLVQRESAFPKASFKEI